MKKYKLLFILSITLSQVVTSQNLFGIAIYGVERIDKSIPEVYQSSTKTLIDLVDKGMQNLEFKLTFNNSESSYRYIEKMTIDSDIGLKIAIAGGGGTGIKDVNSKTKEVVKQMFIDDDAYLIQSSLNDINWTLINETKIIKDYLCYKAVTVIEVESTVGELTKMDLIAWYAIKIPVIFGPEGYGGLPGLILELETPKMRTYIKSLKTSAKSKIDANTIEITKPIKGKFVTPDEFRLINNKLILNYKKGF